jgi:hypothetical protein
MTKEVVLSLTVYNKFAEDDSGGLLAMEGYLLKKIP